MATNVEGKKISALIASQTVSDTDQIVIETKSGTRRVSAGVMAEFVAQNKNFEAVNISELTINFSSKTSRHGGHIYKQGKHITGTLYAAASGNLTALTITKNTAVDGLSIAEASIYFCEVATVSGNPFNLAASKYTMIGVSPVRTTTSSGTTTTSGPCLALYDGSNTVIYAYKGTTGTMTNYFADMVLDYVTS